MMAVRTDARLTGVPDIVTAGAPGIRVWLSITRTPVGLLVEGDAGATAWLTGMVLVPITMTVGIDARLIGVPDTVIAMAPGVRV